MKDYTITYKSLVFNIKDDGYYKLCQEMGTGKVNYSLLLGKNEYKDLNGYESHKNDLPLGIAGEYAKVDREFINSHLDGVLYDKISDKIVDKLDNNSNMVVDNKGEMDIRRNDPWSIIIGENAFDNVPLASINQLLGQAHFGFENGRTFYN